MLRSRLLGVCQLIFLPGSARKAHSVGLTGVLARRLVDRSRVDPWLITIVAFSNGGMVLPDLKVAFYLKIAGALIHRSHVIRRRGSRLGS